MVKRNYVNKKINNHNNLKTKGVTKIRACSWIIYIIIF